MLIRINVTPAERIALKQIALGEGFEHPTHWLNDVVRQHLAEWEAKDTPPPRTKLRNTG